MEFSKFTFIFLLPLFTTLVSAEPKVEIVELVGNVLLQIGLVNIFIFTQNSYM